MKNCLELSKVVQFAAQERSLINGERQHSQEVKRYDVTTNSYDRYGNFNGENITDFSNDVVVRKLRRMLP